MKFLLNIFLIMMPLCLIANGNEDLFNDANRLYDEEKYSQAIQAYEKLMKDGVSSNLHFNLGNSYFMNKKPGLAVFHYHKARLLDPGNPDINANLKFVSEALQLNPSEPGIVQKIAYLLTVNSWSWLLTLSGWFCLLTLVAVKLKFWNSGSAWSCFTVAAIIAAFSLCGLTGYHFDRNIGIVVANEAAFKRAPTKNSPVTSYLSAGEQLNAVDSHSNYIKVVKEDGASGWVSTNDFRKLW